MKYNLVGQNGNAFSLMAYTASAMKKEKFPREEISKMQEEAMSGDYNNLLVVLDNYIAKCNQEDE
ncbi:MAG: hypothetical protein LBD41_04910 [Clostridiales Family XIII bacterium]|nr:hypothetical protein [Clostridiales Family XIII bacterium]